MAPGQGSLRLIRVALFALAAVGLACGAHLAGGESVPPVTAVLCVPVVMIVMNLLAASRRGPAGLFAAMAASQVALHAAFMAAAVSGTCRLVGGQAMVGMPMAAGSGPQAVMDCSASMTHGAAVGAGAGGFMGGLLPSGAMLIWHAVAALALAIMLAHGEAALWALAELLGFRPLPIAAPIGLPAVRRLPVAVAVAFRPRSSVQRHAVRRRGPPVVAVAVC